MMFVFFKQKTAYEMRISDWSSDVCSSDLDLYADGVANVDHLIRVIDPLVAKIRDVQQAINAAQVNKGAIIGAVLDHALDNLAFMQGLDKAAALLGAGFFQDGPARHPEVPTVANHSERAWYRDRVWRSGEVTVG